MRLEVVLMEKTGELERMKELLDREMGDQEGERWSKERKQAEEVERERREEEEMTKRERGWDREREE